MRIVIITGGKRRFSQTKERFRHRWHILPCPILTRRCLALGNQKYIGRHERRLWESQLSIGKNVVLHRISSTNKVVDGANILWFQIKALNEGTLPYSTGGVVSNCRKIVRQNCWNYAFRNTNHVERRKVQVSSESDRLLSRNEIVQDRSKNKTD